MEGAVQYIGPTVEEGEVPRIRQNVKQIRFVLDTFIALTVKAEMTLSISSPTLDQHPT
jgi:hypothetical protein